MDNFVKMKTVLSRIQIYVGLLIVCIISMHNVFAGDKRAGRVDSLSRKSQNYEYREVVRNKMASSAFPVKVSVRGKAICVESNNYQVLPVYNQNGAFFSVFRLSKGVNWINGLPKGSYFINNRKVVIS